MNYFVSKAHFQGHILDFTEEVEKQQARGAAEEGGE